MLKLTVLRILTAAIAVATGVCLVLWDPGLGSLTRPVAAQGSNPPWFPSLMAFEHFDSGRTKLFDQAQFNGSFVRSNVVDVRTSPDDYPTPYNVVYLGPDSLFLFGGAYGDRGGTGLDVQPDPVRRAVVWIGDQAIDFGGS